MMTMSFDINKDGLVMLMLDACDNQDNVAATNVGGGSVYVEAFVDNDDDDDNVGDAGGFHHIHHPCQAATIFIIHVRHAGRCLCERRPKRSTGQAQDSPRPASSVDVLHCFLGEMVG